MKASRTRRDFLAAGGGAAAAAMAAERETASFAGGVDKMDQGSYTVRHGDALFCFFDAYDLDTCIVQFQEGDCLGHS